MRRQNLAFRQAVARPKPKGPEYNPWYWNPNRIGVQTTPDWFKSQLKAVGEELEVTWNPITHRWYVWSRAPRLQHPICQGWRLLFVNQDIDGAFLPLDERVFARLYAASTMAHGSAKAYFDRIKAEMERDKERAARKHQQDTIDLAMPSWEHSQIKVGYGPSNGSKFSTYHS